MLREGVTVTQLCAAVRFTRQAYYKARRDRKRREVDQEAVLELVRQERRLQPRIGARKLMYLLRDPLEEMGIGLGRDLFLELLREHDLLVVRKHRRGARTTDSRHWFPTYPNLLKGRVFTGPHQAWVSDLTYVRTEEGFVYVSLISDVWSRKIVGYEGEDTLEATGCLKALAMGLKQIPADVHPIHHSDRGIQYCCHAYTERLEAHGILVSMTEENHCYENAQAERLNGILKQEYGLGRTFRTRAQARTALVQAVWLFNTRRPHTSLGYRIPAQVHAEAA